MKTKIQRKPGRPRKGASPRVHVTGRIEETVLAAILAMYEGKFQAFLDEAVKRELERQALILRKPSPSHGQTNI